MCAKLFNTKEIGQIIVMKDTYDEWNPSLKFVFEIESIGATATLSMSWKDDDEGCGKRDNAFEKTDEAAALKIAKSISQSI